MAHTRASEQARQRIHAYTAEELSRIFALNHPDAKLSDFYEMELGSAGIMRGYMAQPCTIYFPLERKLARSSATWGCSCRPRSRPGKGGDAPRLFRWQSQHLRRSV